MTGVADSQDISAREKLRALYRVAVYRPKLVVGIICLSVIAAVLEGIGLSFLIPVIEIAQGDRVSGNVGDIGQTFLTAYELLGLPFTLETVIGGVALVMIVRYTSSFLVAWSRAVLKTGYIRYLQTEGFSNALDARIPYYDEHGSDEILNAIVTQSEYASQTIHQSVKIVEQGFLTLMYIFITLYIAPWLTVGTVAILGSILYCLRRVLESGYAVGDRVAEANERIQEAVQAGTQGIREVKLFGLSEELFSDFRYSVNQFADSQIKLRRNQAMLDNIYQMVAAIAVFVLIYTALRFANLELASLGLFLFAVFRLAPRVSNLNNVFYHLEGDLPHLIRMQEFIDELQRQRKEDKGTESPPEIETVAFDDVTFAYRSERVLNDLSFKVEREEFVAFVGPSGAGKSTVVSLLARMYEPDDGRITANDIPIDRLDLKEWRARLSVVRQEPYIFNDTLRYNVTMGRRDATDEEVMDVCETAQVTEFLRDMPDGLDTILGDDGVRLSGGQRQRVAIARALLKPSDVLILDEATSDLDAEIERRVHDGIAEGSNRVLLVIAHRLSTVTDADRIYVVDDGVITEYGPHDELMRQDGVYSELYSRSS